jgi:hypothetical protein
MVKEAVRTWEDATKEVFVPLSHPPGESQVDFGFAYVDVAGERQQVALFVMSLPYSAAVYIQAFPRECTEAFVEGLVDFGRANFLVPVPKVASLVELNETLEERCREDLGRPSWGKNGTKSLRLEEERSQPRSARLDGSRRRTPTPSRWWAVLLRPDPLPGTRGT